MFLSVSLVFMFIAYRGVTTLAQKRTCLPNLRKEIKKSTINNNKNKLNKKKLLAYGQ